ncbi:CoA transferase [Dactylosporangium sp. NPDC051485]|uniref:CaiB/BaiF CoA transferase family protein n=1 Tax=Dactylosporangium sp. NPDC051485 TaxID=3154846 RepID=UPI0034428EFA
MAEEAQGAGRGALDGVRIVDVTQIASGPYATSMLGDFGAEVIKIEPIVGDPLRQIDEVFGKGESSYSFSVNRSKRAISVDLKSAEGQRILHRLLQDADVLMTSMRPSATSKLGLEYATLAPRYPRLIVCSITAYGDDGPLANNPGMDILAQARGGTMGTTGEPGRTPVKVAPAIADFLGSFLAMNGVLLGLRARDRDGVGQQVSINLLDGQVSLLANLATSYYKTGIPFMPQGGAQSNIVPYQVFGTSDGWIVVACLTQKFWPLLCRALGTPELADDPRYVTNALRVQHRATLVPYLEQIFATRTAAEWIAALEPHDVPCAPVNRLHEVFDDPQVAHNRMLLSLQHPRHGDFRTTANPIHLSRTPAAPFGYPPDIGEHTYEVLAEFGYDVAALDALRADGVIRDASREG